MNFKTFLKSAVILPVALLFFPGCASLRRAAPENPAWGLWHIPGAPLPLRINFTPDGRMLGIMGSTNFFAPVRYLPEGGIEISSIAVSRTTDAPDFAGEFFKALRRAGHADISGRRLILSDRQGKKVMTLERMPE